MTSSQTTPVDVYSRVTSKIIADLEQGVRPWHKPWSASHAEGSIIRPLRASGQTSCCCGPRPMPRATVPRSG